MLRFDDEGGPPVEARYRPMLAGPPPPEGHPGGSNEADRRLVRQLGALTGALWLLMLAHLAWGSWLPPVLAGLRDVRLLSALGLAALAWTCWRLLPRLYQARGRDW